MSLPETRQQRAIRRFWAALAMAVGALIATLCGGCALVIAVSFLAHPPRLSEWTFLFVPALMGGLPAVGGLAIARIGFERYQRPAAPRNPPATGD